MLLAHPYPIPIPYEKERPGSDLSSYATLKAVGKGRSKVKSRSLSSIVVW